MRSSAYIVHRIALAGTGVDRERPKFANDLQKTFGAPMAATFDPGKQPGNLGPSSFHHAVQLLQCRGRRNRASATLRPPEHGEFWYIVPYNSGEPINNYTCPFARRDYLRFHLPRMAYKIPEVAFQRRDNLDGHFTNCKQDPCDFALDMAGRYIRQSVRQFEHFHKTMTKVIV